MKKTKIVSCFLLVFVLCITACRTTHNMSSISVEILKPALFALPEDIDTIAVFNRDLYQSDTILYKYINGDTNEVTIDSSIHYSDLSNICSDALAQLLESEGYFVKVFNFRDSMDYLFPKDSFINYPELHQRLGADGFVFLDYFKFTDHYSVSESGFTFFMSTIKDLFPEFQSSTKVERIKAELLWGLTFRNDTSIYVCKHPDILYYGNSVYPELFGNNTNHLRMLENTAQYLGKSFATKIIPSWETVDRTYYRSHNDNMLIAEKYFLENEWLKAAEIYNKATNNKNRNIAAKAKFNMALICEMEGKLDAAIDWVTRSKSTYKQDNPVHAYNCSQYNSILLKRTTEIEKLATQVRNYANNPEHQDLH